MTDGGWTVTREGKRRYYKYTINSSTCNTTYHPDQTHCPSNTCCPAQHALAIYWYAWSHPRKVA